MSKGVAGRDRDDSARSYDAPELHVYLLDTILLDSAKVELYLSLDGTSRNQDVVVKTDGDRRDGRGH